MSPAAFWPPELVRMPTHGGVIRLAYSNAASRTGNGVTWVRDNITRNSIHTLRPGTTAGQRNAGRCTKDFLFPSVDNSQLVRSDLTLVPRSGEKDVLEGGLAAADRTGCDLYEACHPTVTGSP